MDIWKVDMDTGTQLYGLAKTSDEAAAKALAAAKKAFGEDAKVEAVVRIAACDF